MNNNSYIFYGTESEWTQNQSNFDFPYIAYTHDAGNVYISPFEGGGGGQQPEPVYQTFTYTRVFDNFKYLRDMNSDPAGLYAQFTIGGVVFDGGVSFDILQNNEWCGWQCNYNSTTDRLTLSQQFTVDTTLSLQEQIASISTQGYLFFISTDDTYYDNMGIELIWQGQTYENNGVLYKQLDIIDLQSAVSNYVSTAGLSALTNITVTTGMDEMFEPDQNGSGTPFTTQYSSYIYYTGLNTIYDSTGVRQTSIPMRLVFNNNTEDITIGGNNNVFGDFNGISYTYIATGNDAGKLRLSFAFECDPVLTDAEKIALLSNTDYTLYYTGSNIYTQAGDEYECGAASDSNGYILAQFSEYDAFVSNGVFTEQTQTYDIWDNFTQVQGGSGTDMNIPITYTIENLNGIYCSQFDDGEEIGNSITVTNSFTQGEADVCYHRPMDLRIFDTREVSPDNIWDEQYAQYVHELTLDSDFTDTEICGAFFSYDSTTDTLSIVYDNMNFTSGTTANDVATDSSHDWGIRIAIKGESLNYWKYNTFNEDGDYLSTDKKWDDCGNKVHATDYILNISPRNTIHEVSTGEYEFISNINTVINVLTDRLVTLKDYFYIDYSPSTYSLDKTIFRPGNNVLKLEYSNWEGTAQSHINSFSLEYSLDYQQTWQTMNVNQNRAGQILIPANQDDNYLRVWFRAPANPSLLNGISDNQYYAYTFKNEIYENGTYTTASALNGIECSIGGNIMSLIYGEAATVNGADFINDYPMPSSWCFNSLFRGMETLTSTYVWMPAAITEGCYAHMYQGTHITGITINTPDYDPFNDAALSYAYICYGCTNLSGVDMWASLLYDNQFAHAFDGCSALQYVYIYKFAGPASNKTGCTDSWLNNTAASGTIYYDSADATAVTSLPTNSSSGIPSGWTTEAQNN